MISVDMLSGKRELKIRIIKDPIKLLMLLLLCEKNIIRYCVLVISMIPLIGSISSLVVPLLYCVLLLVIIKQKKDFNVRYKEFAVPFFILFSVLVTAIVYPENTDYLFKSDTLINTLLPCLKYYIIGLIIVIDAENMELACKASCVAVVIETLFVVLYLMPRGRLESEDMNRAYQILPNVMICIYYALHSKKAFPIIVGFLGIFT